MPRKARSWRPNTGQHLISRFVDREFRIIDDQDRAFYLQCYGRSVARSDWEPLSYALMSNHVHHGGIAGLDPPGRLLHSAHTRFAIRFHKRSGGLGPVFAARPKSIEVTRSKLLRLVAYHHRNPVKAGVAARATDSTWTSHRAYLRLEPAPDWLNIERSLAMLGFQDHAAGRRDFDEAVNSMDLEGAVPKESDKANTVNEEIRESPPPPFNAHQWKLLVDICCHQYGVDKESLLGSSKRVWRTRRLIAFIARTRYGQSYPAIGEALRIHKASAYNLVNRAPKDLGDVEIHKLTVQIHDAIGASEVTTCKGDNLVPC